MKAFILSAGSRAGVATAAAQSEGAQARAAEAGGCFLGQLNALAGSVRVLIVLYIYKGSESVLL